LYGIVFTVVFCRQLVRYNLAESEALVSVELSMGRLQMMHARFWRESGTESTDSAHGAIVPETSRLVEWTRQENRRVFCPGIVLLAVLFPGLASASQYRGQVTSGAMTVPGATVTATQGEQRLTAITDPHGFYSFAELADGIWTIEVRMPGFSTPRQNVTIAPNMPLAKWELKLLSLDAIRHTLLTNEQKPQNNATVSEAAASAPPPVTAAKPTKPREKNPVVASGEESPGLQADQDQSSSDGFLVNGTVNNAASTPFTVRQAIGNTRAGKGLYGGTFGMILGNSALDARPYSLTGLDTAKASYDQMTLQSSVHGPLRIPALRWYGPYAYFSYDRTRNGDATTGSFLVPDTTERSGDFSNVLDASGQPVQIFDPTTGLPFTGMVPISAQAQALLNFYPLPNIAGNSGYNYQTPLPSDTHQDAVQLRLNQTIHKNGFMGNFSSQSTRSGAANLFGFLDTTHTLSLNTHVLWNRSVGKHLYMSTEYQFSRMRTQVNPYFENRENVSGDAGILGNDQDRSNWGPPTLSFASGIVGVFDGNSSFDRNETNGVSGTLEWSHHHHSVSMGGEFRRQEFNYLSQENPRGSFTFNGTATQRNDTGGYDFADFLLGIPYTSAIAYGNADKYLRESVQAAFVKDDWKMTPKLTVNLGLRWEYATPITELFDRLVNLDISPGFTAAQPVVATDPIGPLTGQKYPSSLVRPDRHMVEPRIGIAWKPFEWTSIVVRSGYGLYADTSVYRATALAMAQQAPLSKSLSVQNSAVCPLTMANGFVSCAAIEPDTFALDPDFRVGYAQAWNLSVQNNLPASLQLTATYLGIKGTRGVQEFLPNTYPAGAVNPCPDCPTGFAYRTSNGNSTREAGDVQLRRKLHSGLTAMLEYTYAKSLDDDSVLGGQGPVASGSAGQQSASAQVAQNWLDLKAERGLSTFDQRHTLKAQIQYTSGMGLRGGTLMRGKLGTVLKDWTILSTITAASGLPETPLYYAAVSGTGMMGSIRANTTGESVYAAPSGLHLNPAAYTAPPLGSWGNARRDSITGPGQFSLNGSGMRAFRLRNRYTLEFQVNATNLLNYASFTAWNTTINSSQFGLATTANPMRRLSTKLNLRF